MTAVSAARNHFGAKPGALIHDGSSDPAAALSRFSPALAVAYSARYSGDTSATISVPQGTTGRQGPTPSPAAAPDAATCAVRDDRLMPAETATSVSVGQSEAPASAEIASVATGRADFGETTPVATGIGNTNSVGTTGNFVNQDINGLLCGSAWATTSLTYSFPTSAAYYGSDYPDSAPFNGFQILSLAQQAVVEYAFSLISAYTGLTFTKVTESASTHATIRFADSSYPSTSYAYYPADSSTGGDVFFGNIRDDAPTKAGYAFDTIMHEIGHAVGLKHGQEDDGTHGVLPSEHDSTEWSIMDYHSYIGADGYYRNSEGSGNQTYMTGDISALQYLYGANYNTESGNTVYTWDPSTGEEFINGVGQGASSTNTIYESIWDGNGTDTYDLSNYTTDTTVNLNPGEWSTFESAQLANLDSSSPGVYLAPGNIINSNEYDHDARSLIEDAFGGSGDDTLIGNTADNVFRGGAGDDVISGGAGDDEAVYEGMRDEYVVTANANGTTTVRDTVAGRDGTDTLSSIETLSFASGRVVADGEVFEVYGSSVARDTQIASGGEQYVYAGGIAIDTLVSSGGLELIGSGGVESTTTVLAGGLDKVNSGGVSFQTTVASAGGVYGEQIVYTGGVATSTTVVGHQTLSGGVASATLVSGGGAVYVSSGGALRGGRLLSGGSAYVGSAGVASATIVSSGGKLVVNTSGFASGTILRSGGTAYVNALGSATGTILSSGGREVVSSGLDLSAVVSVGGQLVVSATGVVSGARILSGGTQIASSGGTDRASLVAVGGFGKVSAGGSSFGATISGAAGLYGEQIVYAGGVATSATVFGHQTLSGGVASATVLSGGGAEYVSSGGALRGARLLSGGSAYVGSAGVASATVVSSGGKLVVNTGGFASGTILRSGGLAYVNALGSATGTILSSGGREVVSSGYDLSAVVRLGGQLVASATGIVSRATILSGGTQIVSSGGVASGTFVSSGGVQYVSVGGVARATRISPSGLLKVFSGGVSQAAVVLSGGTLTVSSGGVASGAAISAGAKELVSAGGIDRASVVGSGGMEFVASAGTVSGTTIVSGAKLTVSAGGVVQAGLTLSGGTAAISGTMAAGQQVRFAGSGGVLGLYNLSAFAAVISGFSAGDRFDLGGFVYGAGETRSFAEAASHTSGTLTVVAGAKTAHLTLLGSYATSNFTLATDNAGGTFVKFT